MSNDNALLRLISNLKTYKVDDLGSGDYADVSDREPASVVEANVVSSLRVDKSEAVPGSDEWWGTDPSEPQHALLLDLDVPAYLVPSSTPGHSHLYVDVHIPQGKYMALLKALADAGVIEVGYQLASETRGATALRLPWIKKDETKKEAA